MNAPIVVGVDGSEGANAALDWASGEAVRRGCGLRLINVIEDRHWDESNAASAALDDRVGQAGEKTLSEAAARVEGVALETEVLHGHVSEKIIEAAADSQAIVLGSRGIGGFTGLMLGSVGLRVAGHAPSPVIVVREPYAPDQAEVVVGVDGSDHSQAALAYAFEAAQLRGVRLRAIRVWVPQPGFPGHGIYVDTYTENEDRVLDEILVSWREKYPEVGVVAKTSTGHPAVALTDASKRAALVVVGSRGHGRIASAVLGSVSHAVLHHAACPVAVVRP